MVKGASFKTLMVIALMAIVTAIVYQNSIGVPFYLDDFGSIVNNPNFKNASFSTLFSDYPLRVIGYFSLFLDFEQHKLSVSGYHYTNVFIHFLTGLVVYFLVRKLCILSKFAVSSAAANYVAMICALVFLVHPLQTQSVTYIVQRLASLVALFYLASVCCYFYARSSESNTLKVVFSFGCMLFAVCAFFTKQNAVTLPLVLVFAELIFFNRSVAKKMILAGLIALLSIGLLYFVIPSSIGGYVDKLDMLTRETRDITRIDYFLAQLSILWIYVGKFFWPVGLHLEYGKTIEDFSRFTTLISAFAHIVVLAAAFTLRKKLPLLAFGIAFFYSAHFVESGIIPIRDLMFEHRTYLPNFGLILVALSLCSLVWKRLNKSDKATVPLMISAIVLFALSYMTYQRNEQWLDPKKFYENELVYSPNNVRVLHNYAEYSGRMGDLDKSESLINRMYDAAGDKIDGAMVNTHIVLLMSRGKFRDAVALAERLLEQPGLNPRTRVHVLSNIGIVYTSLGRYKRADAYFREAYALGGMTTKALLAYAFSLHKNGFPIKALEVIDEIKVLRPNDRSALELEKKILAKNDNKSEVEN